MMESTTSRSICEVEKFGHVVAPPARNAKRPGTQSAPGLQNFARGAASGVARDRHFGNFAAKPS
jgi:hypothetical protein